MDYYFQPIVIFIDTIGKKKANVFNYKRLFLPDKILLRTEPLNYTQ
jgi:hypothetical protein